MPSAAQVDAIERMLFDDASLAVYAVLDGASMHDLPYLLDEHEVENVCLFSGRLDPEVAATAPYLARLEQDSEFLRLVLERGWGHHWGILALIPAEISFGNVRKHFRTFLRVRGPDGEPMLFRYYDPRVMRIYLPTCDEEESETVFGPATCYLMEDEEGSSIQRFWKQEEAAAEEKIRI